MRRNQPLAEFRKTDPREAVLGFSIQLGARVALRASKIFSYWTDLRSFARFFPFRLLTACLQIAAIALLLTVSPRDALESREYQAVGSSLMSSTDAVNCKAQASDEGPAHPRRGHAQCCVSCTAAGRDHLTFLISGIYIAGYCFVRAAHGSVAYCAGHGFFPSLLGWASSWSSRAPPVFS
ncbi:hypothetical protein [Methylocystis sp.]|uniref:hypothetical protein n=1 Tax=Methylocystis sp. TaxID=1911079 RepID=UPI0025E40C98|nr:hypothetical protein [Methylocystis sp.]